MEKRTLTGRIDPSYFLRLVSLLNESTDDYIYMWDIADDYFYISPRLMDKCDLPDSRIHGVLSVWDGLLHPKDADSFKESIRQLLDGETNLHNMDYRLRTKAGDYEWFNCRGKVMPGEDGAPEYLFGVLSLVNERYVDTLTGFFRMMRLKADFAARTVETGSLVIFGVDNFKDINEKYGWHWGNRLLSSAAAAISACLPEDAAAYRLDGDKFGLLLPVCSARQVRTLFERVSQRLLSAVSVKGRYLLCTMSAGCAQYPDDGEKYEEIYQYAESALHLAKRTGKNKLAFFRKEKYNDHVQLISMREALLRSVSNSFRGFTLTYQPQVSCADGSLKGAEALLRWESPVYGKRSPVEFIPLLEESGLIVPVGRWVIGQALEQCARWRESVPEFCMSVNLSYVQLEQDDVPDFLLKALKERGLPPNSVALEITESGQLRDYKYFNGLFSGLAGESVEIAIDDFGTGYSSLAYLKHLNVDLVKVDKCFVDRILSSEYDYRFLRNLIELAHSVALEVCLEGVESAEEVRAVLPLCPDVFQGYYFGRPCPAEEFSEKYLNASFAGAVAGSGAAGERAGTAGETARELSRLRAENRRLSKQLRLLLASGEEGEDG